LINRFFKGHFGANNPAAVPAEKYPCLPAFLFVLLTGFPSEYLS
jgi:hypothetical protein